MFTDTELGMAAGFGQRLRDEQANAQQIINRIYGELERERAAHRRTMAALQHSRSECSQLRRYLAEVDALLN